MPLHPDAAAYLRMSRESPPLEGLSPEEVRLSLKALRARMDREIVSIHDVQDREIPGPYGSIPVRVYHPGGGDPHPVIVYFHGGGWVVGDLEQVDSVCRMISQTANSILVSVDYRLAPEHPFPVALEEAYHAFRWVSLQAAEWGGRGDWLVLAGDSAGASLASVTAGRALDEDGMSILAQVLVYPVCRYGWDTESWKSYGQDFGLTKNLMQWFWDQYLPSFAVADDPRINLLNRKSYRGFPPTLMVTAEYDPLRDEDEAYAARLAKDGVLVEMARFPGMVHGFFTGEWARESRRQAIQTIKHFIHNTRLAKPDGH